MRFTAISSVILSIGCFVSAPASATYWNVFNQEGESTQPSVIDTYDTLNDMLNDTNRTGHYIPDSFGAAKNIIGTGSDGTTYWLVFNQEGESTQPAVIDTYATLNDMLNDTNRTGHYIPDSFGAAKNVVGAGSDGTNYWLVFNQEGESTQPSVIDTYASLTDMLNDTNRTGHYIPDSFGAAKNVVDANSNGTVYWNLFNAEGESSQPAVYDTYASLQDMLNDTNRLGHYQPDAFGAAKNIIASGSDDFPRSSSPTPEPATWAMMLGGFGLVGGMLRRRTVRVRFA